MMNNNFTLIVPAASNSPSETLPDIFKLDDNGVMKCLSSILAFGKNLNNCKQIFITILSEDSQKFNLRRMIETQSAFLNLNINVVEIVKSTSQADTIYRTIRRENIKGPIFIKDADGLFTFDEDLWVQNGVTIYPIENLKLLSPQNKSYVTIDDMELITNIIEKHVISNYINVGGYCFEDADEFVKYYLKLKDNDWLHISHIIYNMLLDGKIFRPFFVNNFIDFTIV